jgi:hypothetical protein
MEAELCAISGAYLTHDDIPKDRLGKPAQLHLQDGKCVLLLCRRRPPAGPWASSLRSLALGPRSGERG